MSNIVNHEEAALNAEIRSPHSNLARCYLDLRAENERLRGLLADTKRDLRIAATCMNPLTPVFRQFNDTADRIDAALAGEKP